MVDPRISSKLNPERVEHLVEHRAGVLEVLVDVDLVDPRQADGLHVRRGLGLDEAR